MADNYVKVGNLLVHPTLYKVTKDEIAIGKPFDTNSFFSIVERMLDKHAPSNGESLENRVTRQDKINDYCKLHKGQPWNATEFLAYLHEETDYFPEEGPDFRVETPNVDEQVKIAAPQLVTPGDKPRFVVNALKDWRSFLDTAYGKKDGTNIIPEDAGAAIILEDADTDDKYNPHRGAQVLAYANQELDTIFPLAEGSHAYVRRYTLEKDGARNELVAEFADGTRTRLANQQKFAGYNISNDELSSVLLEHHGSHVDLRIDRTHKKVGLYHPAGIYDMEEEAHRTVIVDKEDAVVGADADDLTNLFSIWDRVMRGTLESTEELDGKDRKLDDDRTYTSPEGDEITLKGRALALARDVSIHMYTDAVKTEDGEKIPQRILESAFTVYSALHDYHRTGKYVNSDNKHIYIVNPKLHHPSEIEATVRFYQDLEQEFGLEENTILIGIMDEEANLSATLKESIRAAYKRVFFINTGFLDRSASQIATFFEYGPVVTKKQMREHLWRREYELGNVRVGLETFLHEHGQLGKGMHVEADDMRLLYDTKPGHIEAGASTGWVADPKAAVWFQHIIRKYNVPEIQAKLLAEQLKPNLEAMLTPPVMTQEQIDSITKEEVRHEVMEWTQGIMGYASRVVSMGIGCSKVPDLKKQALMEDRATLREKSLSLANWIYHGLISQKEVDAIFDAMAIVVDMQNTDKGGKYEEGYIPMANNLQGPAFLASKELVEKAREGPDGYVEEILWKWRRVVKGELELESRVTH